MLYFYWSYFVAVLSLLLSRKFVQTHFRSCRINVNERTLFSENSTKQKQILNDTRTRKCNRVKRTHAQEWQLSDLSSSLFFCRHRKTSELIVIC